MGVENYAGADELLIDLGTCGCPTSAKCRAIDIGRAEPMYRKEFWVTRHSGRRALPVISCGTWVQQRRKRAAVRYTLTTRVHGPCSRAVNTRVNDDTRVYGPYWSGIQFALASHSKF